MLISSLQISWFCIFISIYVHTRKEDGKPKIKLIDFGSSRQKNDSGKCLNGTLGYFAPERLEKGIVDEKTDVYSCGIVLYYMLCGKIPFNGKNSKELLVKNLGNQINYDILEKKGVSRKLIDFIRMLTQTDPMRRPYALNALRDLLTDNF